MPAGRSGIRFIDDISSEAPAVQTALRSMMREMNVERIAEQTQRAETRARAIAAVDDALAEEQGSSSRLAG